MLTSALHVSAICGGIVLVIITMSAAIRSFVLPRNEVVLLNAVVFRSIRFFFDLAASRHHNYARRDQVQAHYAPVALVALPVCWLLVISTGYTLIFWGLGEGSLERCYRISNSSLLTLGSEDPSHSLVATATSYSEATLGLLLLTLLISYLPGIYQVFSKREVVVARLELRAGTPPTACTLLTWLGRSGSFQDDDEQWSVWETWFVEIEESHTSLPIISFFRSPQPGRSWITAAALILDAAALLFSAVDTPRSRQAELTFKAGCLAINRVFRFFDERGHIEPTSLIDDNDPLEDPMRRDFEETLNRLAEENIPLHPDREAAWTQYRELRSRYGEAVRFLAQLTMAPETKPV